MAESTSHEGDTQQEKIIDDDLDRKMRRLSMAVVRYEHGQTAINPEPQKEATVSLQRLLCANNNQLKTSVFIYDTGVVTDLFKLIEPQLEVPLLLSRRESDNSVESEDASLGTDSENTSDSESEPDGNERSQEIISTASDIAGPDFIFDNEHRTLVDTFEKLDEFLSHLVDLPANTLETPELAMDCEGRDLGRFGSLTLLQIFLRFLAHTFVLDILILEGRRAFDYKHKNGWSVRRLLESDILKIMWDPRQDQDALKAHFDIELGWTMCLQLVELVVRDRGRDREKRAKLMNCIDLEGGAWMSFEEVDKWVAANVAGRRFFRQYTYGVFEQRPMPSIALEYAAGDVDQMLKLWDHFYPRLTIEGKELVAMETKKCLMESMLEDKPEGSAFAPQSIQDLPIIPFVFPVYVPEEPEESPNDADEDDTSSEKSEYGLGEEEPEWQKNSMKHVDYDWSKTVLPGEVKNSWASTK